MGETPPLVTVSGPPAAGTSTLSNRLAREFGYEVVSGGAVFREMADERGLELAEFTEVAAEEESIDRELDERLRSVVRAHAEGRRSPDGAGLVVESRLAGHHAEERADLAVYLDAPAEVRAGRIEDREETPADLRKRERTDTARYREAYGIELADMSVYDLVVDTASLTEDGVLRTVAAALEDVADGG